MVSFSSKYLPSTFEKCIFLIFIITANIKKSHFHYLLYQTHRKPNLQAINANTLIKSLFKYSFIPKFGNTQSNHPEAMFKYEISNRFTKTWAPLRWKLKIRKASNHDERGKNFSSRAFKKRNVERLKRKETLHQGCTQNEHEREREKEREGRLKFL